MVSVLLLATNTLLQLAHNGKHRFSTVRSPWKIQICARHLRLCFFHSSSKMNWFHCSTVLAFTCLSGVAVTPRFSPVYLKITVITIICHLMSKILKIKLSDWSRILSISSDAAYLLLMDQVPNGLFYLNWLEFWIHLVFGSSHIFWQKFHPASLVTELVVGYITRHLILAPRLCR